MRTALQYVVDSRGVKTSVIVPYEQWVKLQDDYQKLQNKLKVLLAVKEGITEAKAAKKKGQSLQSLSDFLHEGEC